MRTTITASAVASMLLLAPGLAHAHGGGVGLGIAGGGAYAAADLEESEDTAEATPVWGFFVDIPLLPTFYISPAAMLYELDLGQGKRPVTDIDLNFKFIVPLGFGRLGAGLTGGITNAEADYAFHYGVLGYASLKLVSNLDAFALVQYKKIIHEELDARVDNVHGLVGGMFYF